MHVRLDGIARMRLPTMALLALLWGCDTTSPPPAPEKPTQAAVPTLQHAHASAVADSIGACLDKAPCTSESLRVHMVPDGNDVHPYDSIRWQLSWAPPTRALPDSMEWRYKLFFNGPPGTKWTNHTWALSDTITPPFNRLECMEAGAILYARNVHVTPEVIRKGETATYAHRSDRGNRTRLYFSEWVSPDVVDCSLHVDTTVTVPPPDTTTVPPPPDTTTVPPPPPPDTTGTDTTTVTPPDTTTKVPRSDTTTKKKDPKRDAIIAAGLDPTGATYTADDALARTFSSVAARYTTAWTVILPANTTAGGARWHHGANIPSAGSQTSPDMATAFDGSTVTATVTACPRGVNSFTGFAIFAVQYVAAGPVLASKEYSLLVVGVCPPPDDRPGRSFTAADSASITAAGLDLDGLAYANRSHALSRYQNTGGGVWNVPTLENTAVSGFTAAVEFLTKRDTSKPATPPALTTSYVDGTLTVTLPCPDNVASYLHRINFDLAYIKVVGDTYTFEEVTTGSRADRQTVCP